MSDEAKRLTDLEDFLFGSSEQPIEEIVSDLRKAGIDTDRAAARLEKMVQEKYREQLQKLAEAEQDIQTTPPPFLADVSTMPRELMLASFEKLRDGEMGTSYQELALARCRNKDAAQLSDEELRSWLSDIADINGDPDGET